MARKIGWMVIGKGNLSALLFDMAFQQLAGSLYLGDVFKGILGDEKKAPGREIQMKKVGRFFKSAEILPFPLLASLFSLQEDALIAQVKSKMDPKGRIAFINAQREESSDRQPEKEPQKGEKQEMLNAYFLEKQ